MHRQDTQYDSLGRVVSHTDLGGRVSQYTYNQRGLLMSEQSSAGKDIHYYYFSDGSLQAYEDKSREERVTYAYDAEGNIASKD
ncbi:MAG: RHS repeat domain-containing protein, partial [Erysipelotrichaceae bacterium]